MSESIYANGKQTCLSLNKYQECYDQNVRPLLDWTDLRTVLKSQFVSNEEGECSNIQVRT